MSTSRTPPPQEAADVSASAIPTAPASQKAAAVELEAPASAPVAAETSTEEAASSSPGHDEAPPNPPPLLEVAESLLARLKPFLRESHIEIEARICSIIQSKKRTHSMMKGHVGATATTISSHDAPHIVEGEHRRIQVGVSAEDFARMKAYMAEKPEALPFQESVTEDVNTRTGRYTYAIANDGSESFIGCIEKRRLCNVEVRVPGCPYDIRVSVSTEVPKPAMDAPAVKPHGCVRRKRRWTATEKTFEYAFTRVSTVDHKYPVFEVEVEGIHVSCQAGVTKAWLADLLGRLVALAQLKGNTGLPHRLACDGD
ncbi:RNA triphosphatase, putative [Leishmania panamensis]|uniref:mRNA 5'-phosphatase n=2 Tax=Leishmania guyanensis species complex TaxID=38579 RepID=A0A088SBN0_LEIPA|nr:RNA triphosphatase, putative [Leishmania panamensis]AIN99081.1 RNA triphosphatase, putative [Leishmania panamensis]CCM16257.1 RNA triphosphatase, putative [Leishmania guyanensis]